jgi:hypothetical protein
MRRIGVLMGAKRRLLVPLQDIFAKFKPGTAVDLIPARPPFHFYYG